MKNLVYKKHLLLAASVMLLFSACEKALDNSIPPGTERREFYNNQIKSYLTNDSLWITQKLDKNSLIFRVGFIFKKDRSVNLNLIQYKPLTLRQELSLAKLKFTSASDIKEIDALINLVGFFNDATYRNFLLTNPAFADNLKRIEKFIPVTISGPPGPVTISEDSNKYDVYGEFNSSLTFLNSSFLSELKISKNFDFDFLINNYNRDSLVMTGYYTQNANKLVVLKPIDLSSFETHFNAVSIINSLSFPSEIKVNGITLTGNDVTYIKQNFNEAYDNLNKNLNFTVKAGVALDASFNGLTALKVTEATYKINSPKPAAGTVLAKLLAYNPTQKGADSNIVVEIIAK